MSFILTDDQAARARVLLAELMTLLGATAPPTPEIQPPAPVAGRPAVLGPTDYEWASTVIPCDVAVVRAVCAVESNGHGFAPDGRPIILFEPHVFSRLTAHRFDDTHGGVSYPKWGAKPYPKTQSERWGQLEYAAKLDHDAAYKAASYGLFQIMGFNHVAAGYTDIDGFVEAMKSTERAHLAAFVNFLHANNLARHLSVRNWVSFATGYNGSGQAPAYAAKLAAAYERFK